MGMGNAGRVCPTKWRRKLHLVKPTMDGFCYQLMVSMATVVLPLLFLLDEGPPGKSKSYCMCLNWGAGGIVQTTALCYASCSD